LVQGGISGGGVCGPLSYLVYRGLFAQNEGLTLPLKPQKEYLGHTEKVEPIVLPEDVLAAIDTTGTEDLGETGSEVGDVVVEATPQNVHETVTPMPTFTSEADAEGTVVPKAVPVTDP
jgi:penicillin-binding protein 2